jgi:hypothetical protein
MSTPAHAVAAISAVAATASLLSWFNDHAIMFTIGAAIAAMLSGGAAFAFYCVSIYFKIKYHRQDL